ncbi:class I ribonucleotide reductase maintenance protein YfaE [Volucribacter amazonae]|uniref:(2Fe-2S)-binding protein n=1 Tax=Volucribacter amazonae TaxID=256731 RepID=A0A9X4PBH7_9PAST|nr:class I ribonucleotide reductase maintenance protein YfaE [Volucribacter amazonae]MDG6894291.1 (2Fe-2S)-binding protein [Volucribacter amazonae]
MPKISLLPQKITLQHNNQISLLENLEQHGIYPEYQCRSGYCGACRAKLIKGKVSYQETPLAFLQPNEILLCCCLVEQDIEIEIKYIK